MRLTRLLLAILFAPVLAGAEPVTTEGGLLDGKSVDGMMIYKGVPFALPPVAELRWRSPKPAQRWAGVRMASEFKPACMQDQHMNAAIGLPILPTSEDCLYLNIWSPPKHLSDRLPVMVWIYGGGFSGGGTAFPIYDGTALAKKGVVVVSIAYRVGALGFLADPELSAESGRGSGDYGLLDQVAALGWVKKNIAAFGGDPDNVTIFGESAGGISVSMLCASPLAKDLFQRAISESGGSFGSAKRGVEGGVNVPPLDVAERQGAAYLAGLGAKSIEEARKLPAEQLTTGLAAQMGGFWPNFDGFVLPRNEYDLYQAGQFNDTPIMVGTNSNEGAAFIHEATAAGFADSVHTAYGSYADKILAAYPATDDKTALPSARNLFRDTAFAWPTWTWARLQTAKGKNKAFVYYFDHAPPPGASHGAELPYVFGTLPAKATGDDRKIADAIETYWTNFAKTGDPNAHGMPVWPAYDDVKRVVMHFDRTPPAAGPLPNVDKLEMLDGYYAWRRGPEGGKN